MGGETRASLPIGATFSATMAFGYTRAESGISQLADKI